MKKTVATLFAAMCLAAILAGCSSRQVDLQTAVTIIPSGFDGEGTIGLRIDDAVLEQALLDGDYSEDTLRGFMLFYDSLRLEATPDTGLANGDMVRVTVSYSEEIAKQYKYKVSGVDFTYTVQGLVQAQPYDAFANITVAFEGISPLCTAVVQNNAADEFGRGIEYRLDRDYDLSNGATVTVTATVKGGLVEQHALYLEETTHTYTVQGMEHYAESFAELDSADIDWLLGEGEALLAADLANATAGGVPQILFDMILDYGTMDAFYADYTKASWANPQLVSLSLLSTPPGTTHAYMVAQNQIVLLYKITVDGLQEYIGDIQEVYVPVLASELVLQTDGTLRRADVAFALEESRLSQQELHAAHVETKTGEYAVEGYDGLHGLPAAQAPTAATTQAAATTGSGANGNTNTGTSAQVGTTEGGSGNIGTAQSADNDSGWVTVDPSAYNDYVHELPDLGWDGVYTGIIDHDSGEYTYDPNQEQNYLQEVPDLSWDGTYTGPIDHDGGWVIVDPEEAQKHVQEVPDDGNW